MKTLNKLYNVWQYWLPLKSALLLLAILSFSSLTMAQEQIRCAAMEHLNRLTEEDPKLRTKMEKLEEEIQQIVAKKDVINGIITIPVVFHVIHNGDPVGSNENIANNFITSQIDQLNDDFRRLNSDSGNTPTDFQGDAADTQIEFCLAQVDPNGDPTTGIERIHINTFGNVNTGDCWTPDYIDARMKPGTIWDGDNYLNIWTTQKIDWIPNGGTCQVNAILGYAQFPNLAANTDGVVLLFNSVGSIADPHPGGAPYNLGRTATHEVGHYLNLFHIWGDDGVGCNGSDNVADTPNQAGSNANCPNHPSNSCGSADMFMNYMDYTDDDCMNMFTAGQRDRMHAAIQASRPTLLTAPCAPEEGCEDILVLDPTDPGTLTGTEEYEANLEIQASNTVASGADVEYHAGERVLLLPDFLAENGCSFLAYIEGCTEGLIEGGGDEKSFNPSANNEDNQNSQLNFGQTEMQVFPNPFQDRADVSLSMAQATMVNMQLLDITGRLVRSIATNKSIEGGTYVFPIQKGNLKPGIYFIRATIDNQEVITRKVVIH